MDPITMYLMLASTGLNFLGQKSSADAQNNQAQLSAQQTEEGRGDSMASQVANFLNGQMTLGNQQAMQGLASTQMDPYAQAKALNSANVKRSMGSSFNPSTGFSSGPDMSALDPSNLAAAKGQFDKYAAAASPNVPQDGDPSAEQFRQTYQTNQQTLQNQILSYLRNIGMYNGQTKSTLYPSTFPNDPSAPPGQPTPVATGSNSGGPGIRGGY